MTREELDKILENHKHWLRKDCDEWFKMRANLHGANLHGANLSEANLHGADLSGANMTEADLTGADLYGATLRETDLSKANLYRANLHGANLYRANLHEAMLYRASLSEADLSRANLHEARLIEVDLSGASLLEADLSGTDLYRANLHEARLHGTDLSGAKNIPLIPYACPDFGMFIGWKKALSENSKNGNDDVLVELEIPEDARRLSATGRKCRCDKAKVLSIRDMDGNVLEDEEAVSIRDRRFIYKVGEIVSVPDFDENRWNECSTGIHFFINRWEAVEYYG